MHMKTNLLLAGLLLSSASFAQSTSAPIVLKAPNNYYVGNISPNGKWACGNYRDGGEDSSYGFRWNLETGEIEMTSSVDVSTAESITDDGTIFGEFIDRTYNANGASISLAGCWKNGKWTRLEVPSGVEIRNTQANYATKDGRFVVGSLTTKDFVTKGYVWENGKLLRELNNTTSRTNMPIAITLDGKVAVGWLQDADRRGCIWEADGTISYLTEQHKGATAKTISPDGTKILYQGAETTVDGKTAVYAIKDVATRKDQTVTAFEKENLTLGVIALNDKGTVMGVESDRGYIYKDGKAYYASDYLADHGVDLAAEHVFMMPETDYYQVYQGQAVSNDDNVMAFLYYNDDKNEAGDYSVSTQSMIVKFNQPTTGYAPASVEASQVKGASSVLLTWKNNIAAKDITGYKVYRNGVQVNTEPVTDMSYVDANLADGSYTYTVTALYGETESAKSDGVEVSVSSAPNAPSALYTTQYGYNSANLIWNAPQPNLGSLTYNDENAKLETFGMRKTGISYETAIMFDPANTKAYKGQKIVAVGFNPLEAQGGWKINLYTANEDGTPKLLYSQPVTQELVYGQRNVVKLDVPQDIPEGDLVVATEVAVTKASQSINAMIVENAKNGYTDLLRRVDEPNFYSLGDYFMKLGAIQKATWTMDVIFAPEGTDVNKAEVDHYNVYTDGTLAGTVKDCSYLAKNLSAGEHSLGVSAVFGDGKVSAAVPASISIVPNDNALAAVDNVAINSTSKTALKATWDVPVDKDKVTLQYCSGEASPNGLVASSATDYAFMAGTKYSHDMFKGRNGYILRSIRFYPTSDAVFTAYIFKNEEIISTTEINDYTLNQWNEVVLSEPIIVDDKSEYTLGIDCFDVTPNTAPLANDMNKGYSGRSDLYSLNNGSSWITILSQSYESNNWMMGLNLESPEGIELPVDGYDVKIDGEKKNAEKITENSYSYDFGAEDTKEHTIQVDVYYTVKPTCVEGSVNRFYLGVSGIDENLIGKINISMGDNEIAVGGDNVKSVDVISAAGATVASAKGNTVSVNGLPTGIYIVKAVVDGKTITRKVQIEK